MITIWRGSAFNCISSGNLISLPQKSGGVVNPTAGGSCGNLSAVTTNVSTDGYCYTSVLTNSCCSESEWDHSYVCRWCYWSCCGKCYCDDGRWVGCYASVGVIIMNTPTSMNPPLPLPVSPGPVGNMRVSSTSVNQLTVTWTPPTTGGVPTSYNVSINDSSSPVVIPDNGSSLYTHTFTGLISDTLYTVSVVTINCVGTSNVTSLLRRTCKCSLHR